MPTPTAVSHGDSASDLAPRIRDALAAANLPTPPAAIDRLAAYLHALLDATARLNLTRITSTDHAIARHLVEPLAAWRVLAPETPPGAILDVGSGGGSPGVPIAIAAPGRPVFLVEARERKAAFLAETARALGLSTVHVLHARAETLAHGDYREAGACTLARAPAAPPMALELLAPLTRVDGLVALFQGPGWTAHAAAAAAAAPLLGLAPPIVRPLTWPGADSSLRLVTWRKIAPTPDRFPRGLRAMRQRPLGVPRPAPD